MPDIDALLTDLSLAYTTTLPRYFTIPQKSPEHPWNYSDPHPAYANSLFIETNPPCTPNQAQINFFQSLAGRGSIDSPGFGTRRSLCHRQPLLSWPPPRRLRERGLSLRPGRLWSSGGLGLCRLYISACMCMFNKFTCVDMYIYIYIYRLP